MKIVNLIENTEGREGIISAHGLSFYIETAKHKILLDLGPSDETLKNAKILGINLKDIDIVILSHGHYDHSGGITPFIKINDKALIYMQQSATKDYYADDGKNATERFRYIGIDKEIKKLSQVRFLNGDKKIDEELELFVIQKRSHELPFANKRLLVMKEKFLENRKLKNKPVEIEFEENDFIRDDFTHEHFLVIHEEGKDILMSGCAHNGILSIMDEYISRYKKEPDVVVSGFHLMKKTDYKKGEIQEIKAIAKELKKYKTKFFTCHCTGVLAYEVMKDIMGDNLEYVHSGEDVIVDL